MTEVLFSRPPLMHSWPAGAFRFLPHLEPRGRSNRKLFIGIAVSIALHSLLLALKEPPQSHSEPASNAPQPLVVHLNQPLVPHTTATVEPAVPAESAPRRTSPPPPRRSILSVPKPQARDPVPLEPPPQPVVREPPQATPQDFSSMLEARRAQRRAAEEALARINAEARAGEREMTADEASSAAANRNLQSLGRGAGGTGGVFSILFKGHRTGQFAFNGWKPTISGGWREVIDVEAGPDGDLEIAMVRRMIQLIRTHYQGDFHWESHRLGRVITLSARPEDSAGLEAFLMREFFQ